MKKILILSVVAISLCGFLVAGSIAEEKKATKNVSGEVNFKEHCTICHPDGGNIINPAKTLHKKDLDANGIKKPADIIEKMRKPGPGMTQFNKETVSDKEANAIATYVLKTFK